MKDEQIIRIFILHPFSVRRRSQVVRQSSAKALFISSILIAASNKINYSKLSRNLLCVYLRVYADKMRLHTAHRSKLSKLMFENQRSK